MEVGESQISVELLLMHGGKLLQRFHLHDDARVDDEISDERALEMNALVGEPEDALLLYTQAALRQLLREQGFIN